MLPAIKYTNMIVNRGYSYTLEERREGHTALISVPPGHFSQFDFFALSSLKVVDKAFMS